MQARLNVPADDSAKESIDAFVSDFAAEHGFAPAERARILILIEELITNVAKYGSGGRGEPAKVEIGFALEGDRLLIEFIDDGTPFDPLAQPDPDLKLGVEDRPVGGLGLLIVRTWTENASYERRDGRNILNLTRRVGR